MSLSRRPSVFAVVFLALVLPACGGGSGAPSGNFRVSNLALPTMLSGQEMDHPITIEGGCGGPYILQVIEGALPPGLSLDNETLSIKGTLMKDGDFAFTVLITDTGCEPFLTTTAAFSIAVGVGDIVVVGVKKAGQLDKFVEPGEGFNPAQPDAPTYNPVYKGLPQAIYNEFVVLDLVVAGGHGPYTMQSYDHPDVEDGQLPFGTIVIGQSTSVSGSPQEEAVDGAFLLTFEITDSRGEKAHFTCNWLVYSPPIELVEDQQLVDGQVGVLYSDNFGYLGGVPPFVFEFVDALDSTTRVSSADYPAPGSANDEGPAYDQVNPGVPSEGMYIVDVGSDEGGGGGFTGFPRRRGTFKVFFHMYSVLLANSALQNRWAEHDYYIAPAPAVAQDPTYTLDPAFTTTQPYARIPDAEKERVYSLTLLAQGGCPQDGWTDAPHESERVEDLNEIDGSTTGNGRGYVWQVPPGWDPDNENNPPVAHMELTEDGIFRSVDGEEDNLVPQLYQPLEFTVTDVALPDSAKTSKPEKVRFSIGPDRIIVTQSSTSYTISTSYDNRRQNDTAMTLRVMIPSSTAADTLRPPNDSDLVGDGDDKITVPSEAGTSTTVATLLSTMDLCRVSINPTGWWDDTNHLNPNAARPFQHSDSNAVYGYYRSLAYAGTTSYLGSSSYSYRYQLQPTATCVRLPKCTSTLVTKDKGKGVYTSGGKLYVFDSSAYFGIFVIREDGRLYVPAAFHKSSSGWRNFGDNWNQAYQSAGNANSIQKIPQMTVSPDGRFGAFKLKSNSTYSKTELADDSAILLISLTGERISEWGDEPYLIVDTGSPNGYSSEGQYHFASSSTLTNRYLYYIVGSGSVNYLHFKDHYIYRYDLFSGDGEGELLHSNFNSNWTNSSGSAMQTPFQMFGREFDLYQGPDPQMATAHGHNMYESSLAPHPFRVNADGNACVIIASRRPSATSYGYDIRNNHVWVDYEGQFHQISAQTRNHAGGGRGIQLTHGPNYTPCAYQWGHFDGPTSRLEISDDGLKVASVYTRYRTGISSSYYQPWGYSSYSTTMYIYRQDVVAYTTTDDWATRTIHEISGDSTTNYSPSSAKFRPSISWRFGALTFTADGDGMVFWGGYSNYSPTAYSHSSYYKYYAAMSFVGTLYSYQFSNSAVKNILSATNGGSNDTVGSAQTSISFSTGSWQRDGGVIKPIGGWVSPNHHFLYVVNKGALHSSSGSRRDGSLLAVNIRSLDTSRSINSRTDGRAYQPTGMDTTNGFYPVQYYIAGYGIGYYYYSSLMQSQYQAYGDSQRAAATDNGWVYFVSEKSVYGYTSTYASSAYGGCINATYYTYNYLTKHLYMFDQNIGGNINKIAGDSWSGSSSYHTVGYIDVADDGATVSAVDSTAAYYDWNDRERLTVWNGVQLDSAGKLVGTPSKYSYESGVYVGSTSTFTPQKDKILYAAGTSNENSKKIKRGLFQGAGTKVEYGFSAANYNILHAGR